METLVQHPVIDEFDEAKFIISKKKEVFRKQIRSKKHNELFQKKRIELLNQDNKESIYNNDVSIGENDNESSEKAMNSFLSKIIVNSKHLKDYLDKICSDIQNLYLRNEVDQHQMSENMKALKLYSQRIDEYPLIANCIIDNNLIQTLQYIITIPSLNLKQLQQDAALIISNLTVSNSDCIEKILENNLSLIDVLVQLLKDQDNAFTTHAIYSLANMSQEYLDVRDEALKRGAAEYIVEKYKQNKTNKKLIEEILWFIAIFSVRPHPYELIKCFIPVLDEQLNLQNQSYDNLQNISIALKNLSEGDDDKIASILEMKNIRKFLQLCTRGQDKVPHYVYQTITNLTFGTNAQIKYLLSLEALEYLSYGFDKTSKYIKTEACQAINNIMCSGYENIEQILNHKYLLSKIFAYVQTGNFIYKKELVLALGNFCMNATSGQINFMRQRGLFQILVNSFQYEDSEMTLSTLEAIAKLLELGRQFVRNQQEEAPYNNNSNINQVLIALENLGLSQQLMQLQTHELQSIYEKCEYIITNFYEFS